VAAQIERDIKLTALERCVPPIYSLFSLRVRLLSQNPYRYKLSSTLCLYKPKQPPSPSYSPFKPSLSLFLRLQGASSPVASGGPGAGGAGGGKGTATGGTGTQQGTATTRRGTKPTWQNTITL
jgi:hypothetical protein